MRHRRDGSQGSRSRRRSRHRHAGRRGRFKKTPGRRRKASGYIGRDQDAAGSAGEAKDLGRLSITPTQTAAVVALLGLGNVLLPLTCVRGCSPAEGIFYAVGFLGGLGLLAVAHGIRRRLPWAWWLGFCMIGFGAAYFVAQG